MIWYGYFERKRKWIWSITAFKFEAFFFKKNIAFYIFFFKLIVTIIFFSFFYFKDFLDGSVQWVSVAMDKFLHIPYGTELCIPELNHKYNRVIKFKVLNNAGNTISDATV